MLKKKFKEYDVIVLDSGIDKDHEIFSEKNIDALQVTYDKNNELIMVQQYEVTYGHGTAIASVLLGNDSIDEMLSVNILHSEFETDEDTLVFALEYIIRNCSPTVVNMSLGITCCADKKRLLACCENLVNAGFILVSAFDNDGAMAFPAAFNSVIGVRSSDLAFSSEDYELYNDTVVNAAGYGKLQRVAWNENRYLLMGGNSLSCAHISKHILSLRKRDVWGIEAIKKEMKKSELRFWDTKGFEMTQRNSKLPYKIKRAVLFPFNKEMHSLIRFSEMLSFEICDVYDCKYTLHVGGYTNQMIKEPSAIALKIKNIEELSLQGVDTIILGHYQELMQFPNMKGTVEEMLRKIIESKVNVYSFDYMDNKHIEKLFCPYVHMEDVPMRRFGMQYKISKPVVGVFGTSSKQGKFTLQLKVRKALQSRGYSVGQIGTEPSSILFGMDEVFPTGYNTTVDINGMDAIIYLNNAMMRIADKENDLILVGGQSGKVTYSMDNIANCCITQYEFLIGTQPDIVILCANAFDEIEYISRTIAFIESSVDCKVTGVVVFPMSRKKDWSGNYGKMEKIQDTDYEVFRNILKKHTGKEIYRLDRNDDIEKMVDTLINKLSEEE